MSAIRIIGFDGVRNIDIPRKVVSDFFRYVEKETQIGLDISTLSGTSTWVTTMHEENGMTICIPAEYYAMKLTRHNMVMEIRYCPCEYCNEIVYIALFSNKKKLDKDTVMKVKKLLDTILPDLPVYIGYYPDEMPIIQPTSSIRGDRLTD